MLMFQLLLAALFLVLPLLISFLPFISAVTILAVLAVTTTGTIRSIGIALAVNGAVTVRLVFCTLLQWTADVQA